MVIMCVLLMTVPDDPARIRYFDAGEGAHCFRDLRSPRTTQDFVTRAIELTDPAYVRTLTFVRLVHAASYVQQREPGGGCGGGARGDRAGWEPEVAPYLRYIRDLSSDLGPYDAEPEVRGFKAFAAEKYPVLGAG